MKQNNKRVTSQWHFANNNDIVVAHVLISGFVQLKTVSFKSTVEIYELMLWSMYESYNCLEWIT